MDDRTFEEIVDDIIVENNTTELKNLMDTMLDSPNYSTNDLIYLVQSVFGVPEQYQEPLFEVLNNHPLSSVYEILTGDLDFIDSNAVNSEFFATNIADVFNYYIDPYTTGDYQYLSEALSNISMILDKADSDTRKFILRSLDDFFAEKEEEEEIEGLYNRYRLSKNKL